MEEKNKINDKVSLEKLLQFSGSAIHEPMLQRIVESAESIEKAEKYVLSLGWWEKTATQVKNAARLRKHYPDTWGELKQSSDRRPSDIFDFAVDTIVGDSEISINQHITIAGVEQDISHLPFFLRHFQFTKTTPDKGKPGKGFNSFDSDGSFRTRHLLNLNYNPFLFGHSISHWFEEVGKGRLSVNNGSGCIYTEWESEDHSTVIKSSPLVVNTDEGMPVFLQTAQIKNRLSSSPEGNEEYVNVFYRQDLGPCFSSSGDVGWVEYVRTIPVSKLLNCVLRMKYRLKSDSGCIIRDLSDPLRKTPPAVFPRMLEWQKADPIGLEWTWDYTQPIGHQINSSHFPNDTISQAMGELANLAGRMYDHNSTPDLAELIGIRVMENPPTNLAELFCKPTT